MPVADTQFRLRGVDPVSQMFQGLAEQGHYAGKGFPTRQGVYICTGEGELLASTPPADADSILITMRRGLNAWNHRIEKTNRAVGEIEGVRTWEDAYPVDGLVLELTVRNLDEAPQALDEISEPTGARSAPLSHRVNFDHVWFSKEEAGEWIPADPEIGEEKLLPSSLVERLACLHFVDSVSGALPLRFRRDDRKHSWVRTKVIAREGHRLSIRIAGKTHVRAEGREIRVSANEIETEILGFARFNLVSGRFDRFEAVALGRAGDFLQPSGKPGVSKRIGYLLAQQSPDQPRTPPQFIHRYEVNWLSEIPPLEAEDAQAAGR